MSSFPLAIGYFYPRQSRGLSLVANAEKARTSALLFPMQRYTVPVTVTVVVPGVTV